MRKIPNGSDLSRLVHNPAMNEWEHAHALNAMIQDVRLIEHNRDRGIKFAEIFWKFWHALHYLESFENVLGVVGSKFQASDFKATNEFLDAVQAALDQDIACFKHPKPAHMESVATWKRFETNRMLREMDLQRTDEYEMVLRCYHAYKLNPCNKHSVDVRTMANYMTLIERIEALEQNVVLLQGERQV